LKNLFLLLSTAAAFLVVGCTQAPTKIYTTQDLDTLILEKSLKTPIKVGSDTIILDVRAPFDFAMSHLPQAVNMRVADFADQQGPYPGRLKADMGDEIKRLALLGISPQSQVVIVGQAHGGKGDEGRLAWVLLYLGISDVQTSHIDKLGLRYSNIEPPPRENAKPWTPNYRLSLLATRSEVIQAATSRHNDRVHILDVRSKNEFFSKNRKLQYEVPDLRAINIEWSEFFTPEGRPKASIVAQLKAVNIGPNDRVIVISNNGVRSGAVAYALLALGYKKAANFAGGYSELLKLQNRDR
jgi:thiosulfate/3-mercaptopyruvate sulfurtransferase